MFVTCTGTSSPALTTLWARLTFGERGPRSPRMSVPWAVTFRPSLASRTYRMEFPPGTNSNPREDDHDCPFPSDSSHGDRYRVRR